MLWNLCLYAACTVRIDCDVSRIIRLLKDGEGFDTDTVRTYVRTQYPHPGIEYVPQYIAIAVLQLRPFDKISHEFWFQDSAMVPTFVLG